MKTIFFACSESSSLDAQTNRISLFHILEDVSVTAVPIFLYSLAVVAILERDDAEATVQDMLINIENDGKLVGQIPTQVNFLEHKRSRTLTLIQGVMIPSIGTLDVVLNHGGRELGRWPINIRYVGHPTSVVQATSADSGVSAPIASANTAPTPNLSADSGTSNAAPPPSPSDGTSTKKRRR
jgi:hypothetical protein